MIELRDPSLLKNLCLINGEWVGASAASRIDVLNPATGECIAAVPVLTADQVTDAIAVAGIAFREWAATTAHERSRLLRSWFDLLVANADDLASILTLEQGKPLREAKSEILYAASFVEWFSEEAKRIYGDTMSSPNGRQRITVLKQPVGVTAAITPWNFPAAMITRKAAPALAAGCTMIVRPSELTPLTALALAELSIRAGIPAGVFQVVTGSSIAIGQVFTRDLRVRKLSFTGSTEVGSKLMAQCAANIQRVSLELGGNAPFIVFDDADIEAAVDGAMIAKFRNAGQTCVCANRLYVQSGIYDAFVARFAERVSALRVGPGNDPSTEIGPLISSKAIAKVEEHINDALSKGATLVCGGKRKDGLFLTPAVLKDTNSSMAFAQEETFGPLAPIFRFETEDEVIRAANATIYGLAAYFYTKDHARSIRVSEALEYGMVGHNTAAISNEVAPFGGVKQSGQGREGSKYGIEEYLEMKYVCSSL